jgi:glycosyltransferase involved in cell wall biosynthesis
VVATRGRPARLAALLRSLREQRLPADSFEVIVVQDGDDDETGAVVDEELRREVLDVRFVQRDRRGGPGAARNDGWKAARGPLVAFIDDDCVASPEWLAAGLEAAGEPSGIVVQGRTDPDPAELDLLGPFSHTQRVDSAGPRYQTCNMFYPRALLDRLAGFDAESFPSGGEDTDLAWRAMAAGASVTYAERARVLHAVARLGPMGKLRLLRRFTEAVQLYSRHPELRKAQLTFGIFWSGSHYLLVRALVAALLPRRLWPLRRWLASAYLVHLLGRGTEEGGGVLHAPYFLLYDLFELVTVVRGAIRYRTLVI